MLNYYPTTGTARRFIKLEMSSRWDSQNNYTARQSSCTSRIRNTRPVTSLLLMVRGVDKTAELRSEG